jgi:hypothetical protein
MAGAMSLLMPDSKKIVAIKARPNVGTAVMRILLEGTVEILCESVTEDI